MPSVRVKIENELRTASLYGDLSRLDAAIQAGADPNSRDRFGNTPLAFASSRGRVEAIRR